MNDSNRLQKLCQVVIAVTAGGFAVYWLRPVLVPFVLALFFASGLAPVLELLEHRLRVPRGIAVFITMILGVGLLSLLLGTIAVSVINLNDNLADYQAKVGTLMEKSADWLGIGANAKDAPLSELTHWFGISSLNELAETPSDSKSDVAVEGNAPPLIDLASQGVRDLLLRVSLDLMDIVSNAVMVAIFMMFILLGGNPRDTQDGGVWSKIDHQVRRYIIAKTVISIVTGLVVTIVLWMFSVPLAVVFGILAFLFNFIPNIGPIIAVLLPLPLVLLELSPIWAGVVMVLMFTIQFISGNVVEPKLMGDSFDLHPVVILLALMFGGLAWGIVGMFLATPILAAVKIVCERFDETRVLAHVLAGRLDKIKAD